MFCCIVDCAVSCKYMLVCTYMYVHMMRSTLAGLAFCATVGRH